MLALSEPNWATRADQTRHHAYRPTIQAYCTVTHPRAKSRAHSRNQREPSQGPRRAAPDPAAGEHHISIHHIIPRTSAHLLACCARVHTHAHTHTTCQRYLHSRPPSLSLSLISPPRPRAHRRTHTHPPTYIQAYTSFLYTRDIHHPLSLIRGATLRQHTIAHLIAPTIR